MQYYLILSLVVVLLNWFFRSKARMSKRVFFLSFAAILVFFAIRYGFGLDYWSYYELFTNERHSRTRGPEETLFYGFMGLFPQYYIFVIAHSAVLFISLCYISFKNIANKYYYLLFFFLLFNPDMVLNMTSAMRSSMAACVIWLFTYWFLIKKNKILWYELGVLIAAGFHTSAILFVVLPLVLHLIKMVPDKIFFVTLIVFNILSLFLTTYLFDWFVGYSRMEIYDSNTVDDSSFMGVLFKMLLAPTAFYLCSPNQSKGMNPRTKQLALLYLALVFLNFDFQGRFTVYLYIFLIAAVCVLLDNAKPFQKIVISSSLVVYLLYNFYTFITMLASSVYRFEDGNFLLYETIFDVATKP